MALDTEWVVRALEVDLGQMRAREASEGVGRPGRQGLVFEEKGKAGLKKGLKTLVLCLLDKWRVLGRGEPGAGNEKGAGWAEG